MPGIKELIIGRPLTYQDMTHERLGKIQALAVFSSDALSSVAYATEAILMELVVLGTMALDWSLPVSGAIVALLAILLISYRQTIKHYPSGGGAYIVAKDNIGETAALIAGGALLLDYLLTVSVSVTAGVEAVTSALPGLHQHQVLLGIVFVWLIVLGNLRGIRESGRMFAFPTYLFIFAILTLIGVGLFKAMTGTLPEQTPELLHFNYPSIGIFMVLKAFSAGCTALSGVEAVSNGVPAFKKPESHNAIVTLIWMAVLLGIMFVGISVLAHLLHIRPNDTETVVSQIARTIFGTTWVYYLVQFSTMAILVLAANTAFADFPRLSSLLALDRYLPRQLASLGDRLVFSNGIIFLGAAASFLIIAFQGDTHLLLPLYAVGVFISFTLSQGGMVCYFFRTREPNWVRSATINFIGTVMTTVALVVISITRFEHGAWIIILLIPILIIVFKKIQAHYLSLGAQLQTVTADFDDVTVPLNLLVLIPVSGLHKGLVRAIRYAHTLTKDVAAVTVDINPESTRRLKEEWDRLGHGVPLVVLNAPFRSLNEPLMEYISDRIDETRRSEREVMLLIPEFVTAKWWQHILHNQTAAILRTTLWFKYPELVVTSVRHRLKY